jgi:hypothetical protein
MKEKMKGGERRMISLFEIWFLPPGEGGHGWVY